MCHNISMSRPLLREELPESPKTRSAWNWKKLLKPAALVGGITTALLVSFETASMLPDAAPERQLVGEGSVSVLEYGNYLTAGTTAFAAASVAALIGLGYVAKRIRNVERTHDETLAKRLPETALPPAVMAELLPPVIPHAQEWQNPHSTTKLSDLLAAQA